MKRLLTPLVLPLLVVGALAACGDDSSDPTTPADDTPDDAPVEGAADAAYPVTIEHQLGTTTFDEAPQRIVSLDPQWTDVLLALDAPLVGTGENPLIDGGLFPWQELPESTEVIPVPGNEIPLEAVAALRPDLIVVTYFVGDQATYDRLNEIAPTVGPLGDEEVDRWQDIATTAGTFLGTPEEAAALIDDAEQASADLLAELPGLEVLDYALANYVPGDAIYVVADPDDGASQLFAQLGMSIDPELLAVADGASGRAELSLEQVGMLDSDLLILLTNGADPAEIPGYASLPAVESGAVAVLDVPTISGLNTPSPLSIPYALDAIRPALEAAAGA